MIDIARDFENAEKHDLGTVEGDRLKMTDA